MLFKPPNPPKPPYRPPNLPPNLLLQNHRDNHLHSGRTCHPHSRHKGQIFQLGPTCYSSLQILQSHHTVHQIFHHKVLQSLHNHPFHHRDSQSDPCLLRQRVHQSPFPCLHKVHQRQGCS